MELGEFTEQEIEILIEAIDEWVNKDFGGNIISELLSMAFSDGASPETKEKMKRQKEEEHQKSMQEKQLRKEQAIILKAKLLKTKDSIVARRI
jgi:hypothetical protein